MTSIMTAEALTFSSLRKEEKKPLATGEGPLGDALVLNGGGLWTCVKWAGLVVLSVCVVGGVFVLGAVLSGQLAKAPPPSPPSPPPPPMTPPPPSSPPPNAPHTDVVGDGTPFPYTDVSGTKVTWKPLLADAAGWPMEVDELLFLEWTATSDGATAPGLGYVLQWHSGGSYSVRTTSEVETICRLHCSNQGTNWKNSTGGALTSRCQHFVMLDQSAAVGVNRMRCFFFRGGYPRLQPASALPLASGSLSYVYSLVPLL